MKSILLSFIAFSMIVSTILAQDTFSMVAADSATRELGSAGASCVDLFSAGFNNASFLGDLLPDTGAINTQASYLAANQILARTRMRSGDTPLQIISWVNLNDAGSDSTSRQYGIVEFSGKNVNAAGYTGENCLDYKNNLSGNINGIYYSIQGNILLGRQVLDSMESNFRNAHGDLACKLMSALQGAKIIGADTRCAPNGSSTLFAFVKVSKPTDKYGSPAFSVSVKTHSNAHIEPIDTLQKIFNMQHNCNTTSLNKISSSDLLRVYPIPSNGKIIIMIPGGEKIFQNGEFSLFNLLGEFILNAKLNSSKTEIDLNKIKNGIYFYQIINGNTIFKTGKCILEQ